MTRHEVFRECLARFELRPLRRLADDAPIVARKQIDDTAAERNLGPTTVRSTRSRVAISKTSSGFAGSAGMHRATEAMPGFPGQQTMSDTVRSRDIFHANACSRPPPQRTRTFT
jgi:hypothetical protein